MNVVEMGRVLIRRWLLAFPLLVLAVVAIGFVYVTSPPDYKAQETILMLPSALQPTVTNPGTNPYLSFGTSVNITAKVFTQLLSSQVVAGKIHDQGGTAAYATTNSVDGTPTLLITATDRHPVVVQRTLSVVADYASRELAARQAASGAPADTYVRASVVSTSGPPAPQESSRLRPAAAVGVVSIGGGLLLIFAVEALSARRMAQRRPVADEPEGPEASSALLVRIAHTEGLGLGMPGQLTERK